MYLSQFIPKAKAGDFLLKSYLRIKRKYEPETVEEQVMHLLREREILETQVDLLVLGEELVQQADNKYFQERRKILTQQCRDPTFWLTILAEAKLYNPAQNAFVQPLAKKYPKALELFAPPQSTPPDRSLPALSR